MPDVTLSITIPDAHVARVSDAFTKASGARMDLNAHKSTPTKEFNANWNFTIDEKSGAETTKEFAVRFILEQIKAVVKMVDYAEDQDRYRTEVSALTPAAQDVPEDVITGG